MRDQIITYLKTMVSKNYAVATELPFDSGKTPLYLKNPKKIYVGEEQITQEPIMELLNGVINQDTSSVTIYFSNDAKQLPSDYGTIVEFLRDTEKMDSLNKYSKRSSIMETEFDSDMIVTRVEVRFSRIIT